MRILAIFGAIAVLLACGAARAQQPTDFLDLQGEKVPLTLSLDRLGILVKDGTTADQIKDFAGRRGYKIAQALPGGVYLLDIGRKTDRSELAQLPLGIKRENDPVVAQSGFVVTGPGLDYPLIVTDEIIIQFKPGVSVERINTLVAQQAASIAKASDYYPNQFIVRVEEASKGDALQLSSRFQSMADLVDFAHPNFIMILEPQQMIPSDPLFGDQWHHQNTGQESGTHDADIDAPQAWAIERGSAATTIAIIDLGFDVMHPDLQPNLVNGWDFVDNDNDPSDLTQQGRHGTSAAGVAAARGNNSIGVSGSCPECSLMLIRIPPSTAAIGDAIGYAASSGAAIISNSWAATPIPAIVNALNSAATTGRGGLGSVVLIAMRNSTGNDCGPTRLPSLGSLIAIGRSTNLDLVDDSPSFGDCMDLMAPTAWTTTISSGKGTLWITTTDMLGPAGYNSMLPDPDCAEDPSALDYTHCFIGSSSSTPLTAGVAGLVLTASPALTRLQVQRLLQDTADKIDDAAGAYAPGNGYSAPVSGDPTHAWGRVNAFEAVRLVAVAPNGRAGVDIFLRDNRLDWGNTEQPSNTLFGAGSGTIGHWESMDIKVDAPPYQPAPAAATFEVFSDETPSAVNGDINRVYVRVRNRGPQTATTTTVKLHWAQFGTALPPLPNDFWSLFPVDSADTSQWHPLSCAATNASTCVVSNLSYSGASVAMTSGDAARIAQFDFPAPPVHQALSNHFCLLAMVDSPQDPISQASKASFFVDGITPSDNNVTHRNYANLRTIHSLVERFLVRNPFDRPIQTELRLTAPAGWKVSSEPYPVGKPFQMKPLEEVRAALTIDKATAGDGIVTLSQEELTGEKAILIGGLSLRFQAEK
ncbi:S8 family serine peptidase [Mesorhizobium sp. M0598]|uniref:S8 family serine peptidase n=1 Tax=Mesorhizobium sp. M0598 TaxID=2956968 RepID=UPI003338FD85